MKRFVLVLVLCVIASMTALAKSFFMITPTVAKNHLKFKQTSDNTWLMYVPATYPCFPYGNASYTGFQFIVGDDEGYLYTPQSKGQMVNGEELSNSGTLTKSTDKRQTSWNWDSNGACLEVKKNVPQSEQKNVYNGMTSNDLVMDGCLVFTITLGDDGNLTYKAKLDPNRRVSYAACNCTNGTNGFKNYNAAEYTTFLFAGLENGKFSPEYKGKLVFGDIPDEDNHNITHKGFSFYTPIQSNGEPNAWDATERWWKQVSNNLEARGLQSADDNSLYGNGDNFSLPYIGSYDVSTTFYYGKNSWGQMDKTPSNSYDDPLVGCIRTYCNEDKDMESRYNVKVFLVTGYSEEVDAFRVTEIPYIPKGVGVLLYTTDATVDILGPEKEWKGEKVSNIEETYGKNYLVPTFLPTNVSTFSTDKAGNKCMNFFLAKLFSAKDYELYKDKYGTDNHWGFFSVLNTQTSKANRAYLQFPYKDLFDGFSHFPERDPKGAQGAKLALGTFDDDNTTTGIKNVSGKQDRKADNAYYTLDGRKVEKPAHGLFIHDGKTYLFK